MIRVITTLLFSLFLFVTSIFAQDVQGDWYGQLNVQGTKLRISFHIKNNNGIYSTTMDSPDQMAFGIPTDTTIVNGKTVSISLKKMMISYKGTLNDTSINGTFSQGGMDLPLELSHQKIEKAKAKLRPQTPKKPYPYLSEEVQFINPKANDIKLSGTLTLPKEVKNPAVAILITGSGPQNRDEELLEHKPFLVIADYLTRNGIAVLRYDDRGVAKSEGTQKDATSADFATDVEAAINYLKTRNDIDTHKIGLIGHSEGGFIAPMVASKNKAVAFIILLAGTGVDGAKILSTQTAKSLELANAPKEQIEFSNQLNAKIYNLVKTEEDLTELKDKISKVLHQAQKDAPKDIANQLTDDIIKNQIKMITSPWMRYFIKTNPQQFLNNVTCPVLALNGSKDFQVLPDLNLNGIKNGLTKSKDVTIKKLDGLNHLFQTCDTGAFSEYATIEETFSPKALAIMVQWINKRF